MWLTDTHRYHPTVSYNTYIPFRDVSMIIGSVNWLLVGLNSRTLTLTPPPLDPRILTLLLIFILTLYSLSLILDPLLSSPSPLPLFLFSIHFPLLKTLTLTLICSLKKAVQQEIKYSDPISISVLILCYCSILFLVIVQFHSLPLFIPVIIYIQIRE